MSSARSASHRRQAGYTLIELMVASAIGLIVMTALTSVVLTAYRASQVATARVEVADQVRSFQQTAYDDFATSALPAAPAGCGTISAPCTHDSIQLRSCKMTNSVTPTAQSRTVTYAWPSGSSAIDRRVASASSNPVATDVTDFSWYLDGTAPDKSVVISLTLTIASFSQSQTMRFYPRVLATLPPNVSSPC